MKTTDVYILGDLSESMWPHKDATQRDMVWEMVRELAAEEARGEQSFRVTFIGFADAVSRSPATVASAVTRIQVDRELANRHGNTALMDAIGLAFDRIETPAPSPPEAILLSIFSDGEENRSRHWGKTRVATKLAQLEAKGNLTVTFAGPASALSHLPGVGIPAGNFRAWDGSAKEMQEVAKESVGATHRYIAQRERGVLRSNSFYADTSQLTDRGLKANTAPLQGASIKVVSKYMDGRPIADFFGSDFRQGRHYYQLIKPEYIQDGKDLIILIKATGEYRQGSAAVRALLGLPATGKVRVHPWPTSDRYEIYVRSDSLNRKVVAGQRFLTL